MPIRAGDDRWSDSQYLQYGVSPVRCRERDVGWDHFSVRRINRVAMLAALLPAHRAVGHSSAPVSYLLSLPVAARRFSLWKANDLVCEWHHAPLRLCDAYGAPASKPLTLPHEIERFIGVGNTFGA